MTATKADLNFKIPSTQIILRTLARVGLSLEQASKREMPDATLSTNLRCESGDVVTNWIVEAIAIDWDH